MMGRDRRVHIGHPGLGEGELKYPEFCIHNISMTRYIKLVLKRFFFFKRESLSFLIVLKVHSFFSFVVSYYVGRWFCS